MLIVNVTVNYSQVATIRFVRDVDRKSPNDGYHFYNWTADVGGSVVGSGIIEHRYKDNVAGLIVGVLSEIEDALQANWDSHRKNYLNEMEGRDG